MANTIKIKRRTDATDNSELAALSVGELGVDLTDSNKLYVGSSSGNQLLNPTASTNADTLDSIDSANFIRSDNNVTVNSTDSNGYSRITVNNGSAQLGLFRSGNSAGGGYLGFDSTNFTVYDGSFNTRLAINTSSGNATFGGTITATGGTLSGNLGINTGSTTPAQKLHIKDGGILMTDENGGQPMFQARNFATSATGSFSNEYGFEYRHATTGGVDHAARIHCNENNSGRKILTVSSVFGTVAEFASNGTCTLASPTISGTATVSNNLTVAGSCTFAALSGTTGTFSGIVSTSSSLLVNATANGGFGTIENRQAANTNASGIATVQGTGGNNSLRLWVDGSGNRKINAGTTEVFSFTSTAISLLQTVTASGTGHLFGKLNVGSVNNSFDFYNNGTSYFNGAVTVDDNLTVSGDIKSEGDGNRVLLESDDYLVAALTRQGTSGSAADQGGLELYNAGVSKVALYANTTSYINNGANFGIGINAATSKFHVVGASAVATTKAEMNSKSVMKLHHNNPSTASTNMQFAGVGGGMGLQVTNYNDTANWDIYLNPFGGNVMIGSNRDPDGLLELRTDSSNPRIIMGYHTGTNAHRLYWDSSKLYLSADHEGDVDNSELRFLVDGSLKAQILSDGKFGVGTGESGPSAKLEIYSTNVNEGVDIVGQISSANQNSDSPKLRFQGYAQTNGPFIQALNSSAYGKKRLGFFVKRSANDYTTAPTESLSIYNSGYVNVHERLGIGGDPSAKLHVYQGDCSAPTDSNTHAVIEDSDHSYLGIYGGSSSDVGIHFGDSAIDARIKYENDNRKLKFAATGTTDLMTLDSTGLGIGCTPSAKLHVNGMMQAGIAGNSSANTPALLVSAAGVNPEQSAIAIQQGTTEGDTIIFADYEPYVEYGISSDNGTDAIEFTAGTSTNNLGSKTLYNQSGNARTAYKKLIFSLQSGNMAVGGRVGIGEVSPWSGLHVKSVTYTFGSSAHYNATIASSNTYTNGHAGGILFAGAYNSSETQTTIAGVWASRPNAGNGMYGGMVHIGGRQHGTSNMPKVLNVNHEAVGINGTAVPSYTALWVNGGTTHSTSYRTAQTFEWSGRTAAFANGSSGLVSKLNFGDEQMWGWIEVTLTDAYNYAPSTGKLTRLYEIGHNQTAAYHYANGKVTESYGNVRGQWKLGDLELVGNNVTIPIIHRTTAGNQVAVHVRGMIHGTNAANILNNLSLSSPAVGSYNTDIQYAEIADMAMSGTNGRIRNDSGNTIIDHDGELVRIPGIAVNHTVPGTHGLYVKDKTSYLKGNVGINATPSGTHALYVTGSALVSTNLRLGTGTAAGNANDPAITAGGYTNAGIYFESSGVGLGAGTGKYLFLDSTGNININGAAHAGEDWNGAIHIKNSSDIGNETSNEAVIYAEGGELKCMDDDRNRTTLSSHINGKWVYMSNNTKTGKSVKIHMEDLVKAVEEHLGVSFSEIVEGAE